MTETPPGPLSQSSPSTAAPLPPVPGYQAPSYAAPAPAAGLDLPTTELSGEPSGYQPSAAAAPLTSAYTPPAYTPTASAPPYPGQATTPYAGYPGQTVAPYQPAGYPLPAAAYGVAPKSKMAAGLLGIFLGGMGVHNFYLGFNGKAIAQLVLFIVSWPLFLLFGLGALVLLGVCIWGLVEGILVLVAQPGTPRSFDAKGVPLTQ